MKKYNIRSIFFSSIKDIISNNWFMVFLWIISIPTISILYLNIDFDKKEYIEYIVVDRYIKYDNGDPEYNYNVVKIKDLSSSNINTISVSEETYYENCDIYFTQEASSSNQDIFILIIIILSIVFTYTELTYITSDNNKYLKFE